jgi:hypothetical protein
MLSVVESWFFPRRKMLCGYLTAAGTNLIAIPANNLPKPIKACHAYKAVLRIIPSMPMSVPYEIY